MFCAGSKTRVTPISAAVPGMSCIRPHAPAGEVAFALKLLSALMTA